MEIFQENMNGVEIFSVKGSLDSNTSTELETRIYAALGNGQRKLILNLEDLDYISSAGIRVMLKTTKDLKNMEGNIVLCTLQDYVREVFDIAGFDGYLNIENNLETAKLKNTLLVLPTGTGKTLIALMLAIEQFKKNPLCKILMLAPTRPLVEQHFSFFKKALPDSWADMQIFTGKTEAEKRKSIWQTAEFIFSTPQCVSNDLEKKNV